MRSNREFELILVFVVGLLLGILLMVVYGSKSSENLQSASLVALSIPIQQPVHEPPLEKIQESLVSQPRENVSVRKVVQFPTKIRYGMTWGLMPDFIAAGYVSVGCKGLPGKPCKAYVGDTRCDAELPILCIHRQKEFPKPNDLPITEYQWSGREIKLTKKTVGFEMTSLDTANQFCEEEFGEKWAMAENHDAGGWGLIGKNTTIKGDQRFWVYMSNQPANCWETQVPSDDSTKVEN